MIKGNLTNLECCQELHRRAIQGHGLARRFCLSLVSLSSPRWLSTAGRSQHICCTSGQAIPEDTVGTGRD